MKITYTSAYTHPDLGERVNFTLRGSGGRALRDALDRKPDVLRHHDGYSVSAGAWGRLRAALADEFGDQIGFRKDD